MSRSIRHEVRVRCSVMHAFETFTSRVDLWWPPSHRRFDVSELRIEPGVGGRFVERAATGEEHALGEVLRWEPPDRLTYAWRPASVGGPTHVDVRFVEDGDETLVEVTHLEGETTAWDEKVALFQRAWGAVLPAFARAASAG